MIDTRILVGLLAVLIAVSGVVFVAINETDRRAEFKDAFEARSIERGAALFTEYCTECHGLHGQGIEGVAPTLNSQYFFNDRLKEIGYQGTLEAYITLTVRGGRPVKSAASYPREMPTWSVDYGGPLRNDQIGNIVDYIMNWQEAAPALPPPGAEPTPVPGDTPEERGANLFQGLGCVGCHMINGQGGGVGPELTHVYANKGEDYIRESVLNPNAVVVEGYQPNIMPQNFSERLSDMNLDDLVAYLKSVGGN
jgi:cbb3-type cytochrome c oxidase subunit III